MACLCMANKLAQACKLFSSLQTVFNARKTLPSSSHCCPRCCPHSSHCCPQPKAPAPAAATTFSNSSRHCLQQQLMPLPQIMSLAAPSLESGHPWRRGTSSPPLAPPKQLPPLPPKQLPPLPLKELSPLPPKHLLPPKKLPPLPPKQLPLLPPKHLLLPKQLPPLPLKQLPPLLLKQLPPLLLKQLPPLPHCLPALALLLSYSRRSSALPLAPRKRRAQLSASWTPCDSAAIIKRNDKTIDSMDCYALQSKELV